MARKNLLIGVALAASLLTACSSGDTATTSSSTTSSTSSTSSTPSSTSSSSSSAAAPSSGSSMEQSSADGSGSIAPADLDDQSIAWFSGFCDSLVKVQTSATGIKDSLSTTDASKSPQEVQTAAVAGISKFGDDLKSAAAEIGALAPPTITQGPEYASAATTGLNSVGDAMLQAAQTFASTPVTDAASLTAASQTLATTLQTQFASIGASVEGLQTAVTPEIKAAVSQLPNCSEVMAE